MKKPASVVALLSSITASALACGLASTVVAQTASNDDKGANNKKLLIERFGEQHFQPPGGFLLRAGQTLPELTWESPKLVATVVDRPAIPTRWFNEQFKELQVAAKPGRYYADGEAPTPSGPPLRRAMTCCCLPDGVKLEQLAGDYKGHVGPEFRQGEQRSRTKALIEWWQTTEEGAVELAAWLEDKGVSENVRPGQCQMENATQHVLLKRKLMRLADRPLLIPKPRKLSDTAPVLRSASLAEAGFSAAQIQKIESSLDDWYAASKEPMAVVIARNGVIALAKGYGTLDDKPVTVDTPMLLHSAMKPLIGVQIATYVDRGFLRLDEPIGKHLPDFNTPRDQNLTHRAGHVHATGIHFPWELAFRRLFYFHTWHESLIAHCRREWEPGARHRYGVVGIILSVRAIELMRGRNYWDAMERDIYKPLGIRNTLPGT